MIKRYSIREIEKIFSDSNKYKKWLKIETLLLEYLCSKGWISKEDFDDISRDLVTIPSHIRREEKKVNHDVVAFINSITNTTDNPSKKFIHYGLTSSDLVDTANAWMFKEANDEIIKNLMRLAKKSKKIACKYKNVYQLNRYSNKTEGVTSFGYRFATFYSLIHEWIEKFISIRKDVETISLSGSVGMHSHLDIEFQDFVACRLDLESSVGSTQVLSRGRYFSYFNTLNSIGKTVERLAIDLRLLSRTEIQEVSEKFDVEQIGSSSMPHKRNPITLENICGLCRLLDSYAMASRKNVGIWLERDISHSSVDRVVFCDGISILIQIVKRMSKVLEEMVVNVKRMKSNIDNRIDLAYKKEIKQLLSDKGFTEFQVDEIFEKLLEKSVEMRKPFADVFKASNIMDFVDKKTISNVFRYDWNLRYLDDVYKRMFRAFNCKQEFESIYYESFQIKEAVDRLIRRLNFFYRGTKEPVKILLIREGSSVFASQLLSRIKFPYSVLSKDTSLFTYLVKNKLPVNLNDLELAKKEFEGKRVLILDEFLDTGTTMNILKEKIRAMKTKDIRSCVLFVTDNIESTHKMDWYGLLVPTGKNIAGYGMDVRGKYRNAPFIGKVKDEYATSLD